MPRHAPITYTHCLCVSQPAGLEKTCCCPASTAIRACLLCPRLQKMMVCSLYPEQDSELRWYSIKKCEVFHSSPCLPSGIAQILFFIFFPHSLLFHSLFSDQTWTGGVLGVSIQVCAFMHGVCKCQVICFIKLFLLQLPAPRLPAAVRITWMLKCC